MRTTIDRIGKYELRAILARTPMSTVYDAWDSDIARRVAVKLMPLSTVDDGEAGEAFSRFKRGAQAAGQLNHPNIVGIYDYGETDDYAYLVMEFVNGPTLKSMFDENRRFALSDICRIIGSVLDALQYSHDRGVVHRDVKPANIMLTAENQVKLTDFGIARLEDSEMTQAGMVIGTPAYMSPEQFLGEKIDWRTDVYSTGVVLYHLLTGDRPYEGNLATIMHKVLYGSPLSPSRVSTLVTPALDAVVTRAMARNREDRFSSAAEFNRELQAALTAAPLSPGPFAANNGPRREAVGTSVNRASTARSRTLVPFAAIAGMILIGGVVGWFALLRPSPPSPADQARHQQEQQAKEQMARLQLEQQARQQQEEQARAQQEQQARLEQEQQAREQQEQQARMQQEQQARSQQEQAAKLQQEQKARFQQEQQARLLQQQQEQARLQQDEQAKLQQEQRARQQQQQDQAKQSARDQARQKQDADQLRQKLAQDQARQRPIQEQVHPKPEPETSPPANILPNLYPVTSTSGAVGLVCESITAETAARFGLESPQGMVVKGVLVGGRADKAGIKEQDVILKINGSDVHELSALNKLAADSPAGQTVPVDIFRRGSHKLVELQVN